MLKNYSKIAFRNLGLFDRHTNHQSHLDKPRKK